MSVFKQTFQGCFRLILSCRLVIFVFSADFHRCNKALSAKDQDTAPCAWYQRVYKSLCPLSWVSRTNMCSCVEHISISKSWCQVHDVRSLPPVFTIKMVSMSTFWVSFLLMSPAGPKMGWPTWGGIFPWEDLNERVPLLPSSSLYLDVSNLLFLYRSS